MQYQVHFKLKSFRTSSFWRFSNLFRRFIIESETVTRHHLRKYVFIHVLSKIFYFKTFTSTIKNSRTNTRFTWRFVVGGDRRFGNLIRCCSVSAPVTCRKWSVLKSPHVYRKARDHFEIRTYRRFYRFWSFSASVNKRLSLWHKSILKTYFPSLIDLKVRVTSFRKFAL